MRFSHFFIIALTLFASITGGIFILKQEKEITIENTGTPASEILNQKAEPQNISTSTLEIQNISTSTEDIAENLISQAQSLIAETQKFIEEEKAKTFLIEQAREKSSKAKGIYVGTARNQSYLKNILDETELNSVVVDVKESYGINLPVSLKSLISVLHQNDNWAIARIVVFRDSSLTEENPNWYLASTTSATTTFSLWRDGAKQYWLDPQNLEVQDYIIDFSKKVIDYGFDELQFDYIRYPDDYEHISGEEKIKVIGDFFSKLSASLKSYKPDIMLSVDLFGYVATQFNSYEIGQRLTDAAKYFDYISFMLYPSHFYGGFSSKGISYFYPEVVEKPYDVIYYSIASARDYLALFDSQSKIRPWLQDFNLAADSNRGVFYDAEKVRLQIDAAQNASSSGWLLWNPSSVYTKEALK